MKVRNALRQTTLVGTNTIVIVILLPVASISVLGFSSHCKMPKNRRAMKDITKFDRAAVDNMTYDLLDCSCDIPDDALEVAAGAEERRGMTWANCTGVWWCWPAVIERH